MTFVAGQVLTAAQLNDLAPLFARKTGDETIASNATLQNDDHLFVSVVAGTYEVVLQITQNSGATPGFKLDFSAPAGTTWLHGYFTCGSGAANEQMGITTNGAISGITGAGADSAVFVRAVILVTTAGTFQFRWAQNTSNASNTIVRSGSSLMLTKVA